MVFQCINIRQVLWEVLKTVAFGLSFQHLPWDLANVNTWKPMFDPYIDIFLYFIMKPSIMGIHWSYLTPILLMITQVFMNKKYIYLLPSLIQSCAKINDSWIT